MNRLETDRLSLKYSDRIIIQHLNIAFEAGAVYSIIGPNGCGKSTLLKALARQLKPAAGQVLLDGKAMSSLSGKQVARQLSYMAQTQEQIEVTVKELVGYGRTPHQPYWNRVSAKDREIADWALEATGLTTYGDRLLHTLSGGERQRAWIAMALAQQPELLLLDEPTTYLDIAHQLEILELVRELNQQFKMTVIMVLHDMNHASVYSDYILAMRSGEIEGFGSPTEVLTPDLLGRVFGVKAHIEAAPEHGKPICRITGLIQK
ncbi:MULTISPECIES: ABC transporter ATP-binding protein [Paenibacillus]|uniref:ATP-binding cassette domain-containing protein n=1 Tax=Paenibacillus campinasensis TaxID=66347 RepID=A0A268EV60_9BACL|nr:MULTISPECIES: ABC transporter ATP-binding protein [Paenibacillus]MUG66894.1 ATP-binding cassette domain-containing protein [Paenibacillus campinasensis]PAD77012.1 iron ABC transporter ATP-binding protein [Paenibacillus campinasensis]PAK55907.1 iron ABC transporter ATP-binding protein [Paenibacillus sp. 7541]